MKIIIFFFALCTMATVNGQIIMNVYENNGNILHIPLNVIDSITYSTGTGTLNPSLPYGHITDQNGNVYSTIVIGNQEWTAENLRSVNYANGDPIPNVLDTFLWRNQTTGAWVYYNDSSVYNNPYGKLYNWYAAADPRNVCPTGWHVPEDSEWVNLINFLDPNANGGSGANVAGGKMKTIGTQYWNMPNTNATNSSGFSALPGGYRAWIHGNYYLIKESGLYWSRTNGGGQNSLSNSTSAASSSSSGFDKATGFSIRCIKN